MKIYIKILIFLSLICGYAFVTRGQDDSQTDLRVNPEIDITEPSGNAEEIPSFPSFINLDCNRISMNGDDWTELVALIDGADSARFNIVHIGDSHLQADMATAVTRKRLGNHYGSAGRALIIPFKLAGTNEPADYVLTTETPVEKSRLLKTPWPTEMGFTGISVKPMRKEFEMTLTCHEPFDSIAVFYSGEDLDVISNVKSVQNHKGIAQIALPDTCSSCTLRFRASSTPCIHGFNLLKGNSGIAYHVIGNNGATYASYNGVDKFAHDVSHLNPGLIIISLGTNEAFGRTSNAELSAQMRTLITGLKSTCPNAKFLLTTPSECQRRTYRGRGRNRRRTGYAVNDNVARLRRTILEFGEKNNIPVYDFYAVAGGDGSSAKWLKEGIMNKDRVHLLKNGYIIQGHLFTDALERAFESYRK